MDLGVIHRMAIFSVALSRLSPRMIFYMIRRYLRNLLVPVFPKIYRKRIHSIESDLPILNTPILIKEGINRLADYYCSEYHGIVNLALDGKFILNDRFYDFESVSGIDWNHYVFEEGDHQMWRVKLAHMGYICPMILNCNDTKAQKVAIDLIESAHRNTSITDKGSFNAFWFPYAASHRILALGATLLIARHRGILSQDLDNTLNAFIKKNVAFVLDNIEYELLNNHLERNLAALCLYFSYVSEIPQSTIQRLENDVSNLINKTILADGTQVERSPMYQGMSIASLAIMAETPFFTKALQQKLESKVHSVEYVYSLLCHPDGDIALFNDSWHGEVPKWIGELPADERLLLKEGGYGRLFHDDNYCLLDAGPIGPSWNPAHGHSDFLSIEISIGGQRLIVDPGTSRYNTGFDRNRERSAAAHNGPSWTEYEPVEFIDSFKVGRLHSAKLLSEEVLQRNSIGGVFNCSFGTTARIIKYFHNRGFLVVDFWLGVRPAQVCWLIPCEWSPTNADCKYQFYNEIVGTEAYIVPISSIGSFLSQSNRAYRYGHLESAHLLTIYPITITNHQYLITWIGHDVVPDGINIEGEMLVKEIQELLDKKDV